MVNCLQVFAMRLQFESRNLDMYLVCLSRSLLKGNGFNGSAPLARAQVGSWHFKTPRGVRRNKIHCNRIQWMLQAIPNERMQSEIHVQSPRSSHPFLLDASPQ